MDLLARPLIDRITKSPDAYACKLAYLMAARANEVCAIGSTNGTHPAGPTRNDVEVDSFEGEELVKILVHKLKIKETSQDPGVRTVAIPLNPDYEPWSREILKEVEKLGVNEPLLSINRQALHGIFSSYGFYELALSMPENQKFKTLLNPLRHLRIHDLASYYKMRIDNEIPAYTGHKRTNSALNRYLHLDWPEYFPKLLKPLPKILEVAA